eukprot:gnl/TRDRNA2_/TRDRNA2_177874_c0_seq16.p1 gnl/TRDRNA2_/TRDRNA2_177874_c0~~gnl/TRDRNA2_/TRDRNA2_177874_c0_seq16.p1  ORF type:complete len:149 (-),score=27.45 gnl/TRDRNA2_/TRDRNA2_177874_c0_seq16:170-616(-)
MLGNALILASLYGNHHNKLKLLVDHGAPLNATDGQGAQAIHAASIADLNSLHELILLGANIHAADASGRQPLHYAAATEDNLETLRFLLSKGADANARDGSGLLALDHVPEAASMETHVARAILQAATEKEQRRRRKQQKKYRQGNEL